MGAGRHREKDRNFGTEGKDEDKQEKMDEKKTTGKGEKRPESENDATEWVRVRVILMFKFSKVPCHRLSFDCAQLMILLLTIRGYYWDILFKGSHASVTYH